MKKIIIGLLICLPFSGTIAQPLPDFKGETVDKKIISIPHDLLGKYSLLCIASSMKAQPDLESWLDPVYQKFIAKTGLMDDMFDVNVYFIPVLTGTNISFAASMKKKFKEYAQADLHPHILFCNENGKELLEAMNMKESDVPYFLLLDKEAKVIYRTSGHYTDDKFDKIDELIQ